MKGLKSSFYLSGMLIQVLRENLGLKCSLFAWDSNPTPTLYSKILKIKICPYQLQQTFVQNSSSGVVPTNGYLTDHLSRTVVQELDLPKDT